MIASLFNLGNDSSFRVNRFLGKNGSSVPEERVNEEEVVEDDGNVEEQIVASRVVIIHVAH